jgi:hypothetical protein
VIQRIFQARDALKTHVKIAYMVNDAWQLAVPEDVGARCGEPAGR